MRSLYIHIPFCEKKCLYCDFYSVENRSTMEEFLDALEREIALQAHLGQGHTFHTVFFGGGTPSLLSAPQLARILGALRSSYVIAPDAEITLETNPGTVDTGVLEGFRAQGVNRLSIGVQSFDAAELRFLTRIHDAAGAVACFRSARQAGFGNVSLDLIYALPGQEPASWRRTLEAALTLGPDHLSAYGLIVEEGTPLAHMVEAGMVTPAPAESEAGMFEFTMETLERHGYEHYEVSNYARPGRRCAHNMTYWSHGGYIGFGPSAHSFNPGGGTGGEGERWWNIRQISGYCGALASARSPQAGRESLTRRERTTERIFLGLRSTGVDMDLLLRETGFDLRAHAGGVLSGLEAEGHARVREGILQLTARGFLLCDEIAARLAPV
jgi:oxygen-independent coproporphyrinogen-3 oxidase